jgi:PAS domain S-box-containing protein
MSSSIPWHRRLEARTLAGVTAIIGLSLAVLLLRTGSVFTSHAMERARDELTAGRAAFSHLLTTRSQLVAAQARLITGLPVFRAHMTDARLAADEATMTAMAEMYRDELTAAFTIVSDRRGQWLASPGLPARAGGPLRPLVAAAALGDERREIVALQGGLFLVVAEPALFGDEVLGTLTIGYALDNRLAEQVAQATGHDVALVADRRISGSSLARDGRLQLASALHANEHPFTEPGLVVRARLGSADYVGTSYPLLSAPDGAPVGRLILLESWEPTAAFIAQVRTRMIGTGALVFVLAVAITLFLSRRLSRPLRQLAEVAREIAAGRWDRRVSPAGGAEAELMAQAFNDMTESLSHWHAEAAQRAEQLEAAYQRYFAVMQSVHDPIVSTDANGAILFWHPRAEALFGFSEPEALGRPFASLLAPCCQERYAMSVQALTGGTPDAPQALTFDGEGIRHDGTPFPLELSLASWSSGGQTCLTAVIRDVTERQKADELLRQRDQQLREAQKMDAIGRLASGIAHDFNNSLMVIQGHAEMLNASLPDDDARRRKVDVIVQATVGAAAITRRLLTFGRKQTSDTRVIDPRELVAGAQKVLGRLLGDNIKVIAESDREPGYIRIDPDQLDQVIMNLAINARDAMPSGGELRFMVRNEGAEVVIEVSDTGCGMDRETAARIFEPFFTTKAAGQGTGLGLSIVYGIITQSDGRIELRTAPDRGTTFELRLPRVERPAEAPAATVPAPVAVASGTETILIAEDKPLVRRILRKALTGAGYTILEAENGEQALTLARAHEGRIHLLLTDVVMPGTGGYDLSQALMALRPETRTVFMSGHPPGSAARAQVDSSGWPCLQKPFSFETLSRAMRQVLDSERAA